RRAHRPAPRPAAGLRVMDVSLWIAEDVGAGDVTTLAVVDEDATCAAQLLVKEPGVVCGLEAAAAVFAELGARLEPLVGEGDRVQPGPVARVEGPARAVATGGGRGRTVVVRLSACATVNRHCLEDAEPSAHSRSVDPAEDHGQPRAVSQVTR